MKKLLSILLLLPALAFGQLQIQNLPPATLPVSGADLLLLSQSGNARKVPVANVLSGTTSVVTSLSAGTGITLTPNPIVTTGNIALTIPVTVPDGGSGATSLTGLILGNGASPFTPYGGNGCTNQFIRSLSASGTATCNSVNLALDVINDLIVANGGTGQVSLTAHGILLGEGTSPVSPLVITNDTVLQGHTGADPTGVSLPNCGSSTQALSYSTSTHLFGCQTVTGSATAPGGATGNVQYNNAGAFAGTNDFTWDPVNYILIMGNAALGGPIIETPTTTTSFANTISIQGGGTTAAGGTGGQVQILGGSGPNATGGSPFIQGGAGTGTNPGGALQMSGGHAANATGGAVSISTFSGNTSGNASGGIQITTGLGNGSAGGSGILSLSTGGVGATGTAGNVAITAGAASSGGTSGSVVITAPHISGATDGAIDFNGPMVVTGTTFTASGCTNSTLVGGRVAGSYNSGTTGTCTVTITLPTIPHAYACSASDVTTPADTQTMTASTTSSATISGTTVTGDTIKFFCMGY